MGFKIKATRSSASVFGAAVGYIKNDSGDAVIWEDHSTAKEYADKLNRTRSSQNIHYEVEEL